MGTAETYKDMERTWLVQRLKAPTRGAGALNPFTFGAGSSRLSGEALELLEGVFTFDYMGAAEFEFGAPAGALHRIAVAADEGRLVGGRLEFPLSEVEPHWQAIPKGKRGKKAWPEATGDARVWYICPREWEPEVRRRITELAKERYNPGLKETTNLAGALRPHHEWEGKDHPTATRGWLELDNGFMFFADPVMYRAACNLFYPAEPDEQDEEYHP